ncbi:DUF3465 domain-containing protein [Bdellovibrio sp. SKB1291214]|uniref:DUF3465 domain-containing protein n=1 Tax=Bdellovibrio sp. SKB1291214 TaxID=1732569 RepID=UPI00223F5854|nr:DUF3465 domain-containing protein [Bdellovibrio sp. SKB1291214]UYL09696.1 DUF3465 domain-containing protein [Bdellovibrio sp. SKB1291214]
MMKFTTRLLFVLISTSALNTHAQAYGYQQGSASAPDAAIVRAMESHQRVNFVEGADMEVVQVLPDDTNGNQHQKWVVRLSNGKTMQAVYNSDMCPRVPVEIGDRVAMGGMFLWTNQGGLLHWLHHDPRGNRPDGYVMINGVYYCKD